MPEEKKPKREVGEKLSKITRNKDGSFKVEKTDTEDIRPQKDEKKNK